MGLSVVFLLIVLSACTIHYLYLAFVAKHSLGQVYKLWRNPNWNITRANNEYTHAKILKVFKHSTEARSSGFASPNKPHWRTEEAKCLSKLA